MPTKLDTLYMKAAFALSALLISINIFLSAWALTSISQNKVDIARNTARLSGNQEDYDRMEKKIDQLLTIILSRENTNK